MSFKHLIKDSISTPSGSADTFAGYTVPMNPSGYPDFERTYVSSGPRRASALSLLTDPWLRFSRSERKREHAARFILRTPAEPQIAQTEPVRFALKLQKLPLAKVLRRQRQRARKSSTLLHILRKLAPDSILRPQIEAEQAVELGLFKQATAEIAARALAAAGKLAERN